MTHAQSVIDFSLLPCAGRRGRRRLAGSLATARYTFDMTSRDPSRQHLHVVSQHVAHDGVELLQSSRAPTNRVVYRCGACRLLLQALILGGRRLLERRDVRVEVFNEVGGKPEANKVGLDRRGVHHICSRCGQQVLIAAARHAELIVQAGHVESHHVSRAVDGFQVIPQGRAGAGFARRALAGLTRAGDVRSRVGV